MHSRCFSNDALVLGFCNESAGEPFKGGISFPLKPFACPGHELHWFSKPDVWVSSPRVGVLDTKREPLAPQGEAPDLWDLYRLGFTTPGMGFLMSLHLCLSCSSSCGPLLIRVHVFVRGNCSIGSSRFVVAVGWGKFKIFLCLHLELPLQVNVFRVSGGSLICFCFESLWIRYWYH